MVSQQHAFHMNIHSSDADVPLQYYTRRDEYSSEYLGTSPHKSIHMYHSSTTTLSSSMTTREYLSVSVESSSNHQCFHPELHRHHSHGHGSEDPEESTPSIDSSSQTHAIAQRPRTPQESLKELLDDMEQRNRERHFTFEQEQPEFGFMRQHHHQRLNPELFKDMGYSLRQNHGNANLRHI
ncbi:hypothetical protein B0O80DRAFT_462110 [Mortierella sp. GBAus27b]|nr:hypothetical protein B0O80DRAFT_462110 [Mortierella sp. GBAus27b]